ncbi:DgyrCDS10019 [Dimorphilus gyrociliatus]|uniref:DgyrCDS10019 n=1 Tax=Dimorphilus gyrociliatus TaxID=2664684 RepID=A0A7I8VZ69_9ANNE|nr:DgyrCDS10019 [Dimorphilus gyrociliatus]
MVLTTLLLFLSVSPLVKPEMFTALVHMEKSIHAEKRLAKEIRSYVTKERERLNELERIANEYESHAESAMGDMHATLANPVSAFLLVKRFTTDWNDVLNKYMTPNNTNQFIASLPQLTEGFPSPEDLDGAAVALLRLQDTYVLPTDKVAKGEIKGVRYSPKMTAQDCFQLGKVAYSQGDYYHTMLWMKEALTILENETSKTIEKPIILDYLAYSTYMQGNWIHALNLTKEWLNEEPNHVRAQSNHDYYSKLIREAKENGKKDEELDVVNNPRQLDEYRQSEEFAKYEALCRGEETQVYPLAHKLTCQYKRHHPYFILRPLKEEIMYFDPWIAIYHDLMTESEVKRIQEMAGPRLHRSGVFVTEDNKSPTTNYRTSQRYLWCLLFLTFLLLHLTIFQ